MTIICATDFSQPAADALGVAVEIAKKRGESLLLWHAVQPQVGDPIDAYVEPIRAGSAARLENEADRIRALGVTVQTAAVIGWPERELPSRMPADTTLIVAGARGHTRGTHWLIGTFVERLAGVAPVPLLVVRNSAGLRSWLSGSRKLNVVVASDFSAVSDFALRRAKLLQKLGPANVEILYVEYPPTEYARLGITGPMRVHRPHPLIDDILTRELDRRAETIDLGGEVTTRVAKTLGALSELIALEAGEANADLVVVGSHQRKVLSRFWHGSIAHGVLHAAETNVLVIPFHSADEDIRALEPPAVNTIVAATDLTPCGNHAAAWACALARPETRVVLVTVVHSESESADAARELDRIKAAIPKTKAKSVDTIVVTGKDAAAAICATAERLSADAVIVGRHTRSRAAQMFIGSVSGEVLARSRRPVMVVSDPGTI